MDAVFTKNIKEQLFLNGSVIVPNIGKLYTVKKMALLDAVRGQIDPPQADIFLDLNSKINDGVLVDAIAQSEGISTTEAQRITDEQTESMLSTLNKYELVALEGFGRFYNDGMGKIHFIQDAININSDSFALPTLKFEPISRTERMVAPEVVALNETIKPKSDAVPEIKQTTQYMNDYNTEPEIERSEKVWGMENTAFKRFLAIGALCLGLIAFFFVRMQKLNKAKVVAATSALADTLSTAPTNAYLGDTLSHAAIGSGVVAESKPAKEIEKPAVKEVEKPEVVSSSKDKSATIIIGAFGNEKNIAKLESWINDKGYEVYSKKRGNLTIVGAKVGYNSKDELNALVSTFKAKYGKEIFVQ